MLRHCLQNDLLVRVSSNELEESIRPKKEVLNTVGIPQQIYHDDEGSWSCKYFIVLLNFAKVKQITTSSPPPFAERMVQTLKHIIHTRLGGLEMRKEKWAELLPFALRNYSSTKHSTVGMTLHMAKQSSNHVEVWLNIHSKANFNRKYPPLNVGDSVRVYIKPKSFKQGHESTLSKICISSRASQR